MTIIHKLNEFEGHTPGPWEFDGIECVSGCGSHPTEEPVFATLHVNEEFMLTEENMLANGKLIAAAPDLLAEVKRLRTLIEGVFHELDRVTHSFRCNYPDLLNQVHAQLDCNIQKWEKEGDD